MPTLPTPPWGSGSYSHEQWELGVRTTVKLEFPQNILLFQLVRMKIPSLETQEENEELWMQR